MALEQRGAIPGPEQIHSAQSMLDVVRERFYPGWRDYKGRGESLSEDVRPRTTIICDNPSDYLLAHLVRPSFWIANISYEPRSLSVTRGTMIPSIGLDQTDAMNTAIKSELYQGTGMEILRLAQKLNEQERGLKVAEVINDGDALFILNEVVKAGQKSVQELHEGLRAPNGWISFSRVWRAGLIKEQVDQFLPTPEGEEVIHLVVDPLAATPTS